MPTEIPDFEERKLSTSELREYAEIIDLGKMIESLVDGRAHVKINAVRAIAIKGGGVAHAAAAIGLLLRDSVPAVRRETALALGKVGKDAVGAGSYLVVALGDSDSEVAEAASDTLAGLGNSVVDALITGLDAGEEMHGRRVAALVGRLPNAVELLTSAFHGPAINVQVNSAIGLGLLGAKNVGAGMQSLLGARTGGDGRTREAVRRAIDMLKDDGPATPSASAVEGFDDQFLTAAQIDQQAAIVQAVGVEGFAVCLQDGRDLARANAATGLGALGAPALAVIGSLGALLRDDSNRVRLAAAAAIDRLGDTAVLQTAGDLVGALRSEEKVAELCAKVLRARKARVLGALVRGLETDDPQHGRRILELINVFPDASEILCDAFTSPAVNVQVNVAMGLGMLGPDRVGKGRKALEGARTGGYAPTRDAVRKALAVLDGPQQLGPNAINVPGFETQLLGAEAFANVTGLRVEDLAAHAQDGRSIVRANAATAIGSLGAAARGMVITLGALLADDDSAARMAAARALDKLGDDAVREGADALVKALRGDAEVAKTCSAILVARKARVLSALLRGLETDDDVHARRILEVINALPDAVDILIDAFSSPAENVQVNVATGIGMLGSKRAGTAGRKTIEGARTGGFARTRDSVFKALAMLDTLP
jgi:HEAT repeat protein